MCEGKCWGVGLGGRRIRYIVGEGWVYARMCVWAGRYAYICVCVGDGWGYALMRMCGQGKVCVHGCLCEGRGWYAYLCMYAGGRGHAWCLWAGGGGI